MTPLEAIRAHCLHCSAGKPGEVRLCPVTRCNLHPFRFGKLPKKAGRELSPEVRAALTARLRGSAPGAPENLGETDRRGDLSEGGEA
jgi:hypothetical protein